MGTIMAQLPPVATRFFLAASLKTSPLTRLSYAYDLRLFFMFLSKETNLRETRTRIVDILPEDLDKIEEHTIELFLDWLTWHQPHGQKEHSNTEGGKMRKLATLRSFFAYLFKMKIITTNVLPNVDMPKVRQKAIVRLESGEIKRVLEQAFEGNDLSKDQMRYHDLTKMRDYTILMVFLGTGIRVSELVGLDIGDINFENSSIRVIRKGGTEAILYLPDEVTQQVKKHLEYYQSLAKVNKLRLDTDPKTPLFKSLQGKRIGARAVQNLVKRYASKAVPLKKITPHKLRSTFGTNLYRETGDIFVVADVLGHRDVNTTKKHYAAISDDIRRAAAKRVKINDE